jgi:malonyl CoA-acyl carrier protein transacylase
VTLITDPAAPVALFPGQGSQTPEMRDLVAERAPDLLERVIALVGEDPFPRAGESTRFAQPAIFCASLAGWDALNLDATAGAGHSLGELAALAAAGVFERDDALRLVVLRGKLMAEADDVGSMLALIGADEDETRAIAEAAEVTVANDNAPGQVILSGPRDKLETAEEAAREYGRRTIPVDVAGAFHSPSMEPAAEPFRAALDETEIHEPSFTVFSSLTTKPFEDVRDELTSVLTRPVRWRETVLAMHEAGGRRFVEVGPGKVLARLGKRILPDCRVETPAEELAHA